MKRNGYVVRLSNHFSNLSKVTDNQLMWLSLFVLHDYLSATQANGIFNKMEKEITYDNSNKRFHALLNHGLIEEYFPNSFRHIPGEDKFYKLSEKGLFTIFYRRESLFESSPYYEGISDNQVNGESESLKYFKRIYINHRDSDLFKIFLFPWISLTTVMNASMSLIIKIHTFLANCCQQIVRFWEIYNYGPLLNQKNGKKIDGVSITEDIKKIVGYNDPIYSYKFNLNTLKDSTYKVNENVFLEYITKIFKIDTKIVYTKINTKDKNKITVFNPNNIPILELNFNDNQKKLEIVSFNDKEEERISMQASADKEIEIKPLFDILIDYNVDLTAIYNNGIMKIMSNYINENDMQLLEQDLNFVNIVSSTKSANNDYFIQNYKMLTENKN